MEERIQAQLKERKELVEGLIKHSYEYLTNTMFWLIEGCDSCDKGIPAEIMLREVNTLFLDDMVRTYSLVPFDEDLLRDSVATLLRQHAIRMELKKYAGRDGSIFYLHTYVVRDAQADAAKGYIHQVDKFAFIAGIGKRGWPLFTAMEQREAQDFIFDVQRSTADHDQEMTLKLNNDRMACSFPLKQELASMAKE